MPHNLLPINRYNLKKTKIICTIGPSTSSYENLEKLIRKGMNAARMNCSHGSQEEFKVNINNIRKLAKEELKPISIILDLQGPKLRVGNTNDINVQRESVFNIGVDKEAAESDQFVPVQFNFIPYLEKKHSIYFNDGYLKAEVIEVSEHTASIKFLNDGVIKANNGINIPDTDITDILTAKDKNDLNFASQMDVDYIALSFVNNSNIIDELKSILSNNPNNSNRKNIKIIAKIETKSSILNIDGIINKADMIMIARGDLAIEIGLENVPIYQNEIIEKCKKAKKPVIVATQMLESMIEAPTPTRAEVSDIANSTFSEVDAVMLSAETAIGKYPFKALEMMTKVIMTTENNISTNDNKKYILTDSSSNSDAISSAAVFLTDQMKSDILAVATESGKSAISLAALRPMKSVAAITQSEKVYNQLALIWGITPFFIDKPVDSIGGLTEETINILQRTRFVKKGSKLIFVTGLHVGITGETNSLRIIDL